jgi:hypothetical protein
MKHLLKLQADKALALNHNCQYQNTKFENMMLAIATIGLVAVSIICGLAG